MRDSISGHDDQSMVKEAERGEDASLGVYKEAIESMLPPSVRDLVQEQYADVQKSQVHLRALEIGAEV